MIDPTVDTTRNSALDISAHSLTDTTLNPTLNPIGDCTILYNYSPTMEPDTRDVLIMHIVYSNIARFN